MSPGSQREMSVSRRELSQHVTHIKPAQNHKDTGCDLSFRDDLLTRGKTAQFDQGQKTVGFPPCRDRETAPTPRASDW